MTISEHAMYRYLIDADGVLINNFLTPSESLLLVDGGRCASVTKLSPVKSEQETSAYSSSDSDVTDSESRPSRCP